MFALELACAAIVALYVTVRLGRARDRGAVALRLVLVVAGAWLGENSVIHAYGFYEYSPGWHLFLDRVPLLIVLIWPVVLDSAWQLSRHLGGGALLAAAIVLADASLIEPIAVQAGLWRWTEPGLFAVPPIGILGWALFTFATVWLGERFGYLAVLLAPLATHALLLACWWSGLRWVSGTLSETTACLAAWAVLLPIATYSWRRKLRSRVPFQELALRLPGALFFLALLVIYGRSSLPLVVYALAFVPPYLTLMGGFRPTLTGAMEDL